MSVFKKIFLAFALIIFGIATFFSLGSAPPRDITWGVNFSQTQSQNLGLDWRETYAAIIDELGVKEIKLAVYWDLIEQKEGEYDFEDLDWQIKKAGEKNVNLILAIGRKAPRWPECHEPAWVKHLSKEGQQEKILNYLEKIILRYKDNANIWAWQVENEPFFPFGECSWVDKDFLKKEVALVKSLDSLNRPVVISDSGEGSLWIEAARYGDIVGTTMYRKVWARQVGMYFTHIFQPAFYWRKAQIIEKVFGKKVINVELQAEPWGPEVLPYPSLEEQAKTMTLEKFRENVNFARRTGLSKFYFWGAEWWYWMKIQHNQPEIWNETQTLF